MTVEEVNSMNSESAETSIESSPNPAPSLQNPEQGTALKQELESLRLELASLKGMLSGFSGIIQTQQAQTQTDASVMGTSNLHVSTGNEGVPTNRQTDIRQTLGMPPQAVHMPAQPAFEAFPQQSSQISPAALYSKDMLSVVESLKSDLKIKFRNLTKQEFKVFAAIYVLEEQGHVDYRSLASYLGLTESSIRDYIMKMEKKGIPIVKVRINNKKVVLQVRQELRQIVSLDTLMKVREPIFR